MKKLSIFVAGMMLASPAWAQSSATPVDKAAKHADKPEMCEMMHNGMKMQGTMMKGKDGKMACCMMDHAKMDHGMMDHGMMDHSGMDHGAKDGHKPNDPKPSGETSPGGDHAKHDGHSQG